MRINRIWLVIALILVALGYYEARLKPQSRPLYERALALYKDRRYELSLLELEKAYEIEPNSTAILVLRGWDHLKLKQFSEAREDFARANRLDSQLVEPQLGLAYVALETGQGEVPVEGAKALLQLDPSNRDFALATASALRQSGNNLDAQKLFKGLLNDAQYGNLAKQNLEDMYGIAQTNEKIPEGLPPLQRPSELRVGFRAHGPSLQARMTAGWKDFYVKGINLVPAPPGSFATEAPTQVQVYQRWLNEIAQLGANTIRVYTVLPPAFYRALKRHNEAPGQPRLYLLQQVWLVSAEENNLFLPAVESAARKEIAGAVDALHGQGDLPMRKGHASGLYTADVSEYVLGLLIGQEMAPHLVGANNALNSFRNSYSGKYLGVEKGSATEVWLAGMLDYAAGYEVEKYNEQRPLSIVNWPPLDPLTHPTEAGLMDEMKFLRKMGERVGEPPSVFDDDDSSSLDENRFRAKDSFQAGLFASYSVYPFYPDFLLTEPALLHARDRAGPNNFFGYLKALKTHYLTMPLLVTEYGVPSSIGVSHLHPNGWNEGGLNERDQGDLLARMTQNIAEAGCAGGVLFEWQDAWFMSNWLTAPFETPEERRALWFNVLNPRESFGLWTYDPSQSRLFSADSSAWGAVQPLYRKGSANPTVLLKDGGDAQRALRSLSVSSDEAFLYLRLSVQSLPRGPDGAPQLNLANYVIGISTRPGYFGSRTLPGFAPRMRISEGFNFLLHVAGAGNTRLLVASNYNPWGVLAVEGSSNRTRVALRRPWKPLLENWSDFEEMIVEPNRLRFSRDGTPYPAQRYSRSPLRYGSLDPSSPQYSSLATWYADFQSNSLIFRLPWGMLFVTDPSSLQVYAGTEATGFLLPVRTEGFAFFALSFRPESKPPDWSRLPSTPLAATDFLPAIDQQLTFTGIQKYHWVGWNTVNLSGHLRASALTLQKSFRELKGPGL